VSSGCTAAPVSSGPIEGGRMAVGGRAPPRRRRRVVRAWDRAEAWVRRRRDGRRVPRIGAVPVVRPNRLALGSVSLAYAPSDSFGVAKSPGTSTVTAPPEVESANRLSGFGGGPAITDPSSANWPPWQLHLNLASAATHA